MPEVRFLVPTLVLALIASSSAQEPNQPASPELQKATAKAKVHNKRVLAVLTGKDQDLTAALKKDRTVSRPVLYEFETVQFAGEQADAMALQWKMPDVLQTKPGLAVLDSDGKVLARLLRDDFMADGKIAAENLLAKLKPHYCAPVDADQKLAAAIDEGKKTGRAVFVRFDAPWWGWCKVLEEFLGRAKVTPLFSKGWVDVMIDVDRDTHGKEINERLKGQRPGGLPWMVILDGDGKEIVSSNAEPKGENIGGPATEEECAWFGVMLQRSRSDKVSEAEIAAMLADLEEYSKPRRKPKPAVAPPGKAGSGGADR